jgi:four helix bundle protein
MLKLEHKSLDVWKLGIELVAQIYDITEQFPKSEQFGLTNQLRRASVSISSNIAEGSSRISPKERFRFYEIARSSLVEVDTQFEIAMKVEYVTRTDLTQIAGMLNHLFAKLTNLMNKTR